MGWRNCGASLALIGEVNTRWPARDRSSDGTIGDAAHASRSSDHNPWVVVAGMGVVRARDIDKDGIDAPWLAEYLRQLGARGDNRLTGGGYVIFNRRITVPNFSGWKAYTGSNPHTHHLHVSFSRDRAGFDSSAGWGIAGGGSAPAPATGGDPLVRAAQAKLKAAYRGYAGNLIVDGIPGPKTAAALREFQARSHLPTTGVVDAATRAALRI